MYMYLKFDDKIEVTVAQLKAIAAILGLDDVEDLKWFYNIHYETCKYEIECACENNMDAEELEQFKQSEDYEDIIYSLTDILYDNSEYQWDSLYEKADAIVSDRIVK